MLSSEPSSPSVHTVQVDPEQAGQRVDNFLIGYLKGVPKSRIYRLLRKGEVRVNKGRIKAEYRLAAGDRVRIPPVRVSAPKTATPSAKLLSLLDSAIVYEDEALLAINKPCGLAVHGGTRVDLGLIETLRHHYGNKSLELVHRLDRETSGVVLVAKRRSVLRALQQQFRDGEVEKHYRALVAGRWPESRRRVEAPLVKNQLLSGERMVLAQRDGKPSVTEFSVLERFDMAAASASATLLDARPITGRTHQIRVHAQYAGHPIIGDEKYGDGAANKALKFVGIQRLFLHAAELHFRHPASEQPMSVGAPLSADLNRGLAQLRQALKQEK